MMNLQNIDFDENVIDTLSEFDARNLFMCKYLNLRGSFVQKL